MVDSPVIEREARQEPEGQRRGQWLLLAGFIFLAAIVVGLAYWAWTEQAGSLTAQAQRSLNAVAELKAGQIAAWQAERRGDAELIRGDRLLSAAVTDLRAGRDIATSAVRVRSFLEHMWRIYGYVDVTLVDPGGRPLMTLPAKATFTVAPRVRRLVAKAQRTGEVVSSDLYLGPDGVARIEMVAPVLAQRPADPAVACVVLHTDPNRFLYPFIQDWALPNATGETLLVERRGDNVVYLNDLRHRSDTALRLSVPASRANLPAAMAVRGKRGIVEGVDYRGVPVMAAIAPVVASDWHVVAKVDKSEVLDPIRRRGWLTAGFTLLIVVLAAVGTILLWRLRERQVNAELVASERKFRETVESLEEGYYSVTLDGALLDHNPAYCRVLGIEGEPDLRGQHTPDFWWNEEDRDAYVRRLREEGHVRDFLAEAKRADGSRLAVILNAHFARGGDGAIDRIEGTVLDFTARKAAEDEVARLNAELEQRVADRTAELDGANRELEAFAYSVSHDLRAPLRHISGFSALLAERAGDQLDDKGRHYVEVISTSVRQMGILIDDLLQFSRTGRAELVIEPVDMQGTLDEALKPLRREADGRDVEWSIGDLPPVVADRALVRQVWANLVDNAVKYTRGRSPAKIEVGAASANGEFVFYVRDNGVGFDMQYAHKLFGVFQRLHSDAEFEGTGIGLANVKRIVTRLGGAVWAEGEPGQGATFYFSLPNRKEATS